MDIDGIFYCSRCMRRLEKRGVCPFCGHDDENVRHDSSLLEEGTLLKGRYQLGAVIGRGGFGITYAAWDETLQMAVAIKEYFPVELAERNIDDSDDVRPLDEYKNEFIVGRERFRRESKVLAMLHEIPGIVQVLDCFSENETFYIAMEYIHGVPLDKYVWDNGIKDGDILDLMRQPIEALIAMHRLGVLHRDISPDNIMVAEDGTVKLIDFGAAAQMDRQEQGHDHTVVLKRKFAALEQHDTSLEQGPWTDVYDMCATLYMLLTGEAAPESVCRVRFDEIRHIGRTEARIKRHQQKAIMAGLQVLPEKRIQNMEIFRSVLYAIPFPDEVVKRRRIRQRLSVCAVVALVCALAALMNFTIGLPLSEGMWYSLRGDGAHIVGGYSLSGEVTVPSGILGFPVTKLEADVFARNEKVTGVELPGTIKTIENSSFNGCYGLRWVRINEGAETVGRNAFYDCIGLQNVYLPDSVINIGGNAFDNAPEYMTVWCSDGSAAQAYASLNGLEYCEEGLFEYENDIGGVIISGYNGDGLHVIMPSFIDGIPVIGVDDESAPTMFGEDIESVVLPQFLREIPDDMFSGRYALSDVEFGTALVSIGKDAFRNTSLVAVELPDTMRTIGDGAFGNIESLASVHVGINLERIGNDAFADTAITEIKLPEMLMHIGDRAFCNVPLTELKLPSRLRSIGERAFSGTDIVSVTVPYSTGEVGRYAFAECVLLESAVLESGPVVEGSNTRRFACSASNLPEGIFMGCESLKDVQLPEGLLVIGHYSFSGCSALENLILPKTALALGDGAFEYCVSLQMVSLPDFSGYMNYLGDALPQNNMIGDNAFLGCRSDLVLIGNTPIDAAVAKRLGFEYCPRSEWYSGAQADAEGVITLDAAQAEMNGDGKLMMPYADAVKLPCMDSEGTVMAHTVGSMQGLNCREVVLPRSVQAIADGAFADTFGIERVTAQNIETIGDGAFNGCDALKYVQLTDGLESIGDEAFAGCISLTEVELPDTLILLGEGAFNGCIELKEVAVPDSLTYLPDDCFAATGLEYVELPGSISTCLGAFRDCANMKFAVLGEGCKMALGTFSGCGALEKVELPSTMLQVDVYAFSGCTSLREVWVYGMETELGYVDPARRAPGEDMPQAFEDCTDVVIYAYPGSAAEEFAQSNGLDFEPITEENMGGM